MVEVREHDGEHIDEERRRVLEIKADRLVVDLRVGHLCDRLLELDVLERDGRVLHHREARVVKLVVVRVQEDELLPVVAVLARREQLADVELGPEELDVLHQLLRAVLCVEDAELGEDAHVRALEVEAALHQLHHLVEEAVLLVRVDQALELVRVDDDEHRADLREAELLRLDARRVHLLPRARRVCLSRRVHGLLVLGEVHEARGEARPVGV
mmetsp:Transcript_6965/g.21994  ORF Transcript_6965/g.21994 Transcript_6965/m.21994 type:complete len:213 (+) Transcript_6965:927-1565(+)